MTKQRDAQVTKRVDYAVKDATEQTATGVVMVPNTVDHQGDWERPETIEAFATQFEAFIDVEEADGGVMHAVWPSEWMTLERNEVIAEAEEIGDTSVPEGAWVQTWQYHDDDLWSLVEDDILGGHSIGAVNAKWDFNGSEPDDLPDDVTVPDAVEVAEYWELTDGIVQEVSAVDIPAVPDAQILSTSKAQAATAEKRLADHLGNRSAFVEEAQERGHSESEADRLWDVLDRAVNVEGAGEPGAKAKLTSAATAFLNALTGSSGGDARRADAQTAKDASEGDISDDGGSETEAAENTSNMSDSDEPPEWAQELKDQVEEQSERLDAALDEDGNGEKDADAFADAPEWAQELKEDVDKQAERIDAISKQTGATESQQLGGAEKNSGADDGIDKRAAFFTPESKMHELAGSQGGR
jgi:hypothetical protein